MKDTSIKTYFDVAEKMLELYCRNSNRFYYIDADGQYHRGGTVVQYENMIEHLEGGRCLSIAVSGSGTYFMSLDIDESDPECVHAVVDVMEETGIPRDKIYVSCSGGKGYHVEVFFTESVYKTEIKNYYSCITNDPRLTRVMVEARPIGKMGIKLPLGVNHKTGNECWYVDRETLEPIEDFEYIFEIKPFDCNEFKKIVKELNYKNFMANLSYALDHRGRNKGHHINASSGMKAEPVITKSGERHMMMCKMSAHLRYMGCEEEQIYEGLLAWVARQDQSLIRSTQREIEKDARDMARSVCRKYAPKVELGEKTWHSSCELSAYDIGYILSKKKKSARRIAFFVLSVCRSYGRCNYGYEKIQEITGISYATAVAAIKEMVDDKAIIIKSKGGIKISGGKPVFRANVYVIPDEFEPDTGIDAESIMVDIDEMVENFDCVYYVSLLRACDKKTLEEHLSKAELRDCKAYAERMAVDGTEDTGCWA